MDKNHPRRRDRTPV